MNGLLATVPVHETSLTNHHFIVYFWEEGGGYKKSTLCTLVKMLKIMDDPLEDIGHKLFSSVFITEDIPLPVPDSKHP